ncbi:esterase/lipase family protein [Aporhodopirellula aestuarii]|uniref:Lipase n=1 Tax=Aporhodopirellula aestuarii TaxID=2950107 RepID=A0ABT0U963_9BACT|nr:lipase [Aporhodopirellula aestuarii]MCM2373513.1 lipase [Aporhodopirellula aestuarii]
MIPKALRRICVPLSIAVLTTGCFLGGCEAIGQTESDTVAKNLNVPMPTIGGAQLWTDLENRSGYRVQRNAVSGHCRVLDPRNIRRGWGSETDALLLLDELCPEPSAPAAKPMVILLHGLMRTDSSMKSLEKALRDDGYDQVIRFGYASTRSGLADSAAALRRVLEGQHSEMEFCFVGHSMGNIVTRHLIGDLQRDGDPKQILPRCRSMVMLGPPNHGATIARRLAATGLFGLVAGPGAMELGTGWEDVEAKLATPPFPFAIVAGKVEPGRLRNPLVEGDSDFVVSLEEAKLAGAESIHEVPVLHSFLMNDEACQKWTTTFLDEHLGGQVAAE